MFISQFAAQITPPEPTILDRMREWFAWVQPEYFDTLIIVVLLIGGALSAVRIYRDLTRPMRPRPPYPAPAPDDTQPGSAS